MTISHIRAVFYCWWNAGSKIDFGRFLTYVCIIIRQPATVITQPQTILNGAFGLSVERGSALLRIQSVFTKKHLMWHRMRFVAETFIWKKPTRKMFMSTVSSCYWIICRTINGAQNLCKQICVCIFVSVRFCWLSHRSKCWISTMHESIQ